MKIIEDDEDFIRLRLRQNSIEFDLYTDHGIFLTEFTPLEAYELGCLLKRLAGETDYFKGFKKE